MKFVLVLAFVLVIAGCTSAPAVPTTPAKIVNPAPKAIEVGVLVPITGSNASAGAQGKAGYEFAAQDINKAGGIVVGDYGKLPLNLTILDDESDVAKRVSQLESLLAQGKIVAFLGGAGSDGRVATIPVAEKNHIAHIESPDALWKIHQQGYKYLFSPFPKSPDVARDVFDCVNAYVPEAQRPTKVAIFQEKSELGVEIGDTGKENAPLSGYTVVYFEEYPSGTKDYSVMINKAKAAGTEMVFASPTATDGTILVKQMATLDFNPKLVFLQRAPNSQSWSTDLGKLGDDVVLMPGWSNALNFPGVKELNAAYLAKFGRPADAIVGPAYASVQILAAAIERAGALDRDKIRDALVATDMYTVMGRIRFRADGTAVVKSTITQWQNGKQELVCPKDSATAALNYPRVK